MLITRYRCRKIDQNSSSSQSLFSSNYNTSSDLAFSPASEPRDIVPRAAPSRPNSMHFGGGSSSPPATPGTTTTYHHSSALSALRSLNARPPSPASPTGSSGGGIWPFSSTRSAATSPSTSYTRPSTGFFSSTYDTGYSSGGYGYDMGAADSRPLPSRHPRGYRRPRSIELVAPKLGR
jgi:hypothetical protein